MIIAPTLHPAYLLRSAEGETGEAKFRLTVINDFKKALNYLKRKPSWREEVIWERKPCENRFWRLFPSCTEVLTFLRANRGKLAAIDIETTGEQPMACRILCVGIATVDEQVICIPFIRQFDQPYWTEQELIRVLTELSAYLADPGTPKCFHNGPFDTAVLGAAGLPVAGFDEDTLAAHHVVDGELPHNLGFCASINLEAPYWKDDVKGGVGWLDLEDWRLRSYNCLAFGTPVVMADGRRVPIQELVRTRSTEKVLAVNAEGELCAAQIYDWHQNRVPGQDWLQIDHAGALEPLVCTPDHRVFTYRGLIEAREIQVDDFVFLPERSFTHEQRQFMIGTLLGDTSIRVSPSRRNDPSGARTAYLDGGQVHRGYVDEKIKILNGILLEDPVKLRDGRPYFYRFRSKAYHELAHWRRRLWVDGVRRLPLDLMEFMGARGLAWWFGDDGCRQKHWRGDTACLAICRYPIEDQEAARAWFAARYAAPVHLGRDGVLRFSKRATWALCAEIGPYLPQAVRYKLPGAVDLSYVAVPTHTDLPAVSRVISVTAYAAKRETWVERYRADSRFCISTTEGNFFTSRGLVKNCRDCLVDIRILGPLKHQVYALKLEPLYKTELHVSRIMTKATRRGVMIDLARKEALGNKLRGDREAAHLVLRTLAGDPEFKPGSQPQLQRFLFERMRFPIVLRTDKGAPSTNKNAMAMLAVHADLEEQKAALKALVKWRKADKMLGTWVEGLPILVDRRIHASWKMLTVSGRLASSPNLQNLNKKIKSIFRAAPGHKFVGTDLSQAELRIIAYWTGDTDLLQAYRDDLNVHTVNATLLFQIRTPGINTNPQTEAYLSDACPRLLGMPYEQLPACPKEKWEATRRLAKNFVFANNYGALPETIYEVLRSTRDPETDEAMFPDIELGTIEALQIQWADLHPSIPVWWKKIEQQVRTDGHYRCPISGRIRWFRAGFKRNEILNFPIQAAVSSWINQCTERIDDDLVKWTNGQAEIVIQVHDSLVLEVPDHMVDLVIQLLKYHLSHKPFVPGIGELNLPPDKCTVGDYLNEV